VLSILVQPYSVLAVDGDWDDNLDPSYDKNYEVDHDAYMLQASYKFNDYVAIEGRYWGSFGDGDLTVRRNPCFILKPNL